MMGGGAALTPAIAAMLLFGVFFALMFLRVPVAFALGLACLPVMIIEPRLSPMILFNETFKSYNSFILLAVPFFLLTANLMNVGGITDRLVRLSRDLVGHLPGGLAKKIDSTTFTCASPPGRWPTRSRESRTSRSVMPPTFIRLAVSRKNGTASRMNEL